MARIYTPISNNRGAGEQKPALRTFKVEEPSANPVYNRDRNIPEGAREVSPAELATMRQRAQQKTAKEEESELLHDRDLVEQITGIGRRYKTVEVKDPDFNHSFTLRTLKGWEKKDVIRAYESIPKKTMGEGIDLKYYHDASGEHLLKLVSLSHALCAIDGTDLDMILGISSIDDEDKIGHRRHFVEEMDDYLTDYLYIQYNLLCKQSSDGYVLKYPNSLEEQKVAAEAIRKSS